MRMHKSIFYFYEIQKIKKKKNKASALLLSDV
jgi:hypothetical protein